MFECESCLAKFEVASPKKKNTMYSLHAAFSSRNDETVLDCLFGGTSADLIIGNWGLKQDEANDLETIIDSQQYVYFSQN